MEGDSGAPLGAHRRRRNREERKRRNRSRLRTKPTPEQKDLDRRSVLEAVALLWQENMAEEASGGDSDRRTHSTDSDKAPRVTPRMADDL
ncbi:hypothetical protein NDU88_006623 [Pleurodeles waltl]|uniref:Uncharacterized protein n=1 Tax=Pleurodeles waltl TaxID=8319 RepID=A0AAV7PLX7_PLEWA|nr:hypothetical protein NDU88_006623 [Pleurodeles waltl]